MTRYLTVDEVVEIHGRIVAQSGGSFGLREAGGLDSAVAQPQMTFGGNDLYATLADKAAALGFSLVSNHPFVDGNKRIGHAAMETFLVINGHELNATVDEQEQVILRLAAGEMGREEFTQWVREPIEPVIKS
jgi:death-on-curing protein